MIKISKKATTVAIVNQKGGTAKTTTCENLGIGLAMEGKKVLLVDELLSRDELAVLDGGKCILQLRGVRPFLSDKYDLTQHPNYKLTSDYDPKNTFDIEKYLNRKEKIHPGDEFIVVDADSLPSA